MDDITIGVTEFVNNILVSAQPNDQTIDITVTETVETVLLDVATTVQEVTVTATQNVIVENITVDYVNNENNIDINVTDGTQDVTLNVTPTLVEINILRSGGEVNILQFNTLADFPATGSSDYFYLAKDTNKLYRWTGSAYAEIAATANARWGQIIGTLSEQTDLQNALNLKAPLNSPTFTGTVSGITKVMVGLGAVDNTSDLDKPISTATQTALNNKQPLDGDLTSIAALSGTFGLLKKTANNSYTIDTNTYLTGITSSDVTTALGFTPENVANKGVNNGYASLDGGGKVPSSQLPSYVDDVIEVSSFGTLPMTGETGKIYITLDTNKIYRWSGSVYVEVSSSAAVWGGITGTLSAQTDLQNALDAKQDDLNGTGFVKASGTTISYDNTTYYPASNPNGYTTNVGTVTSVAMIVPSAFSVSGSPITSSGTLAVTATGNTTQYIAGDGSLVTFPTIGTAGTLTREVRNTTGATLNKGTVVYISGATGNKPTVSKAIATGDSTSAQTFGLVQADISNNANGNVVCVGDLTGLNTSAFTEGAQLYLSSTTAGTYTVTKQLAPNHLVYIGVVTRAHPTLGQIEVNIQNGYELYEIHDVSITSEVNNQGLFYEASTDLWKNKSIATVLGYTPANGADYMALSGNQSISGTKTFTTQLHANVLKFSESGGFNQTAGFTQIGGTADYFSFANGTNTKSAQFTYGTGTAFNLPSGNGTLALTSDLHNAVTIGTANGLSLSTQVLSLALASTSATGALSSTDWNTFNGKQSALSGTGFVKISGSTISYDNNTYFSTTGGTITGNTAISVTSSSTALTLSNGGAGYALYVQSNSYFQGSAAFQSLSANGMVKADANKNLVAAVAGTDYVVPSALSSYLPLSGGTLTGALSGTSATFSGAVTATGNVTARSRLAITKADNTLGASIDYDDAVNQCYIYNHKTGGYFSIYTNAVERLQIASTGAATFSSSVKVGSGLLSIQGAQQNNLWLNQNAGGTTTGFLLGRSFTSTNSQDFFIYDVAAAAPRFVISSSGNVGIGTTAPNTRLHTTGSLTVDDIIYLQRASSSLFLPIANYWNGSGNPLAGTKGDILAIGNSGGDGLVFVNGNTERMRITSGGNVGIGTTAPTAKLHLKASSSSDQVLRFEQQNDITSQYYFNIDSTVNGALSLVTNYLGGNVVGFSQSRGGNVGIGTTAPNSILEISATTPVFRIQASDPNVFHGIEFRQGAGFDAFIKQHPNSGEFRISNGRYSGWGGYTTFYTDGTERMRITSGGNVLIGTTTDSGNGMKLQVTGAASTTGGVYSYGGILGSIGTASNSIGSGPYVAIVNSANAYQILQQLNSSYNIDYWSYRGGWTNVSRIDGATGVYTPLSDKNKKKDFEISNIGLKEIMELKPTLYRMKDDESNSIKQLGFIAQEVKEIIPQSYVESDGFIGLNDRPIVAALTKAVQELKAELDILKNK